MKTKKIFGYFVLTLCMCFGLTSCSLFDFGSGDNSIVVGTWVGDEYDTFYSNVTITFNSDGTGSATIDHNGGYSSATRAEFTYRVRGSKVTTNGFRVTTNSDGDVFNEEFNNTYEVEGSILKVVDGSSWYLGRVTSYKKR